MTDGKVLVIDDEPVLAELLCQILDCHRIPAAVALDGLSGLDLAQALCPDVVILDVMLPDIDGFEVCRRLRSTPATAAIGVVILTSLSSAADRAEALAAGADEFISKPFKADDLIRAVRAVARRRLALTPRA
jgi:DNA-binding response OmpR family regulator